MTKKTLQKITPCCPRIQFQILSCPPLTLESYELVLDCTKAEIAYCITHYTSATMYENRDAIYRYETLHNDSLQTSYVTRGKKKQHNQTKKNNDKEIVNNHCKDNKNHPQSPPSKG